MSERASYLRINYALRPGKNIQRKMIAEMCSCLKVLRRVSTYRYIGLGSPFFSDFSLFHRRFGFRTMISIEKEKEDRERFEFNKPLNCIEPKFGESTEVLSDLYWKDIPSIVWMDYDTQLDTDKTEDIRFLVANLASESFLIVTLRAVAEDFGQDTKERLTNLKTALGDRLPHGITPGALTKDRFPGTLRGVIDSNILSILGERNRALPDEGRFQYAQVLNSTYNDGTMMLTVGGILIQKGQVPSFVHCDFSSLDFYRDSQALYHIRVPSLTYKEQRHLDEQLPGESATSPGVPQEDVEAYERVYRYFPKFVDAEI